MGSSKGVKKTPVRV